MKNNKFKKGICLSLILGLIFFYLSRFEIFKKIELITYDWRMSFNPLKSPSSKIVLVFIGEETLKPLGGWPIPREWYAEFTKVMKEFGARATVYDILFLDSKPDEDKHFSTSMKTAGNVILPYFFYRIENEKGFYKGEKVVYPVSILKNSAAGSGFVNCPPDKDGIIRRYPLFVKYNNRLHYSFGISILKSVYHISKIKIKDRYVLLEIDEKVKKIPVDSHYSTYINFYSDLSEIPNFSFIQVMKSYLQFKKGEVPMISPEEFSDKIVIVALTATGITDIGNVSGVANYPLVGVHISFLENFLKDEFIRKFDEKSSFFIPFFLSLITVIPVSVISPLYGLSVVIVLSFLFAYFSFWIFKTHFIWVNISTGIMAIFTGYLILTISQFVQERREKFRIKNIFGKYVPSSTVDKLLEYKNGISLSGERKYLTVLFADIRGFTSISERLSPEETFKFLNESLKVMTEAVFEYGGMLDKFIGDEIMAIFGAPVEDKNHPLKAVLSAIEMMKKIRKRFEFIEIGIGINTGDMVIGNIGTEKRMEYTAIGDAVNLASRVQEIAKGGEILITENTYQNVREEVKCEFIGEIKVKGKEKKVMIYKVIWEENGGEK